MDSLLSEPGKSRNGILFSHKKNEVLIHATIWVKTSEIMLSERSQSYVIIYDSVHKEGQNKEISRHRREVCGC